MEVKYTDSDDILYESKLNIDGFKTCEGRSPLCGQTLQYSHSDELKALLMI